MSKRTWLWIWTLALAFAPACGDDDNGTPDGADADVTETGADADADADADVGADADADVGADADADVGADTDADIVEPCPVAEPVVLSGELTGTRTLDRRCRHRIDGYYKVRAGATLTIEPGTVVMGDKETKGTLVVFQGGRLVADGRADAPIVFTSAQPPGARNPGDWGGVVLMGRAPINTPGGTGIAEGGEADWVYGGTDPDDDSGVLRYVRIEFAGIEVTPDNELNGLSLYAVGRGTVLDYIQIHMGLDDGIEFFGGTVDIKHLLVTAAADDSIDWDLGWVGRGQYVIAQQDPAEGDNGIEADNNKNDHGLTPRSHPVIANITLIGQGADLDSSDDNFGWQARRGTAGELHGAIIYGFDERGFDFQNPSTCAEATSDALTIRHSIVFGNDPDFPVGDEVEGSPPVTYEDPPFDEGAWFRDASRNNRNVDPQLADPFNLDAPDFRPRAGSPALSGGGVPADTWFERTTYVGAVGGDGPAWYEGWTAFPAD